MESYIPGPKHFHKGINTGILSLYGEQSFEKAKEQKMADKDSFNKNESEPEFDYDNGDDSAKYAHHRTIWATLNNDQDDANGHLQAMSSIQAKVAGMPDEEQLAFYKKAREHATKLDRSHIEKHRKTGLKIA